MNPQDSGVVTGESEKTAPEQKQQSLSEEILALMKGEEPLAPEAPPEASEEIPTPTETEIPQQTEEPEVPEEEPAAPAAEGEWPQSAKKRVSEETEKRKKWQAAADKQTTEVLRLNRTVEELSARLQEASRPRPSSKDPLADVFDAASLRKAEAHYQNIKDETIRALEENPTSDEIEVVVGKNKDGEPVTEMFSRKKLVNMRINAEHALSKLIPEREKVLVARGQADALAFKVYPQFAENEGNNEWTGFVRDTLADFPELSKVPDIAIWLGHALIGRRVTLERLTKEHGLGKNGEDTETPTNTAKEIISAASKKFKAAPPVSTGRVPSQSTPRRGADVETAKREMRARPGDDDAMEKFIDAKLFKSSRRGYDKVS